MMSTIHNGLETKVVGEENVEKVEEKSHLKLKLGRFGNVYVVDRKLTSTQIATEQATTTATTEQGETTAAATEQATTTAIVSEEATNAS
ncbi:hypothetical protein Tco_1154715 [Tanacetum coccineum]